MSKGTILNFKKLNNSFIFLKNNWCILLLTALFIIGITAGTFLNNSKSNFSAFFDSYSNDFLKLRILKNFFEIFTDSFLTSFIFILLIFLFGTSVTGPVTVPLVVMLRGMIFGSLVGNIYSQFELKGITFNAVILIPSTLITVIFLLIAAKESMQFSLQIIDITLPNSAPKNLSFQFGRFCKRQLILVVPIIFSAILDAWLSTKLIPYFDLF